MWRILNYQQNNGSLSGLVPKRARNSASRALVLSWDDAFTHKQDVGDRQLMYGKTAVKLLDGPLRGWVLWVPNLFLRY